jgi:hypothetical protein
VARKLATELLVERLAEWGVDTVFGLPGDSLLGFPEYGVRFSQPLRFAAFASSCKVRYEQAKGSPRRGCAASRARRLSPRPVPGQAGAAQGLA